VTHRTAAEPRRNELARTEEIAREARPLRNAERIAARLTPLLHRQRWNWRRPNATSSSWLSKLQPFSHQAAAEIHSKLLAEQKANELPLRKARALDETLSIMQTQHQKASADLEAANTALKTAEQNLKGHCR
jgi:hypothetical protein